MRKVFHSKVPIGRPLKKDYAQSLTFRAQSLTFRAQSLTLNFLQYLE
jgi:hypothetical protein